MTCALVAFFLPLLPFLVPCVPEATYGYGGSETVSTGGGAMWKDKVAGYLSEYNLASSNWGWREAKSMVIIIINIILL